MTIWFASGNAGKKTELAFILAGAGVFETGYINFRIPKDEGLDFDPEETGDSFHANSLLKAVELYSLLNRLSPPVFKPGDVIIADDSGINVDALGGRPGIYSALYTGRVITCAADISPGAKKLPSVERNTLLLGELGDNPHRTARFVCSMVLFFSPDRFFLAQETLEGEIVKGPEYAKGTGGFGYDPILFIPELNRTVAELTEKEKNTYSHRAKAGKFIAELFKKHAEA